MAKQNILNDNTSWGVESTKIESNFAELYNDKIDKTSVVQTTGASLSDVMSQKAVTDELDQLVGDISHYNCSYNKNSGGVTIFTDKTAARESVPVTLQKNGLIITYKTEEYAGWYTEQYIGTASNWSLFDYHFIDITKKIRVSAIFAGHSNHKPSWDSTSKLLNIPEGILSLDNGIRINVLAQAIEIPNGFVRIISSYAGVLSTKAVDSSLNLYPPVLTNEIPTEINVATCYIVNNKLIVMGGISLNEATPLLLSDERAALLNIKAADIDFNLSTRKIIITGGAVISKNGIYGRYNLPIGEVDMPFITNVVVLFNTVTNQIIVRATSGASQDNCLILFSYYYDGNASTFSVSGIENYLINGKEKPLPIIIPNEYIAYLSVSNKSSINFDLQNRKIKITGGYIINNFGTSRIALPVSEVEMPASAPLAAVLYDETNNTVFVRNQASPSVKNALLLFNYSYSGAYSTFFVNGISNYSVNNVPNDKLDYRYNEKLAVDNIAIPFYHAPIQEGVGLNDSFSLYTLTSTMLHSMYDNVVSEYVTKNIIGQTEGTSPYDVIQYTIRHRNVRTPNRIKPKIFIVGGTHGGERIGVYTTYLLFKQLALNQDKSLMVEILRKNYDFIFIPCSNPYALNVGNVGGTSSERWNHNGVDINRNYDWRWDSYPDDVLGSQTYKGLAPFSEKESQIVRDAIIAEEENLILVIDVHNFGAAAITPDYVDVWYSTSRMNVRNICHALSDRVAHEFKTKYNEIDDESIVAYADYGLSMPTLPAWVANVLNINSLTLETSQSNVYNENGYTYDSDVVTRSLTAHINSIYSIARHLIDFYNAATI